MKNPMKNIIAAVVAAVGLAAFAEPKVEITSVDVGQARDGVFTYSYVVSGVTGTCDINVKITAGGGAKTKSATISNQGNGTGSYAVDTKNDTAFDKKAYADVAVFMSIAGAGGDDDSALGGVQLWENGPYWATCNVGADSPGDPGLYFWWGGTIGYRYVNGKWTDANGIQTNKFVTSLCPTYAMSVDQLREMGWLNSDGNLCAWCDAATANLGAPWRMPTNDELQGLVDNCTTVWTNLYGTIGRFVKGKGGYASKGIFMPAAGYSSGSAPKNSGKYGRFWSSTPDSDSDPSWFLSFGSDDFSAGLNLRYCGLPVRPVR